MKKQFYRVKQLADQRVGRAEKTEILTEELQHVEKTVDKIRQGCSMTSKRLIACMQGTGLESERRLRKLPQMSLGQSMLESSNILGEGSLLGGVLACAGEAQVAIAKELTDCELEIESNVLSPLSTLLEGDIPNISKTKKNLSKARLDMDTCKSRWQASAKTAQSANKDMIAAISKAETLKNQFEDETNKFETCRDQLSTDLLSFVAREAEYADWIVKLVEAQLLYHRNAAACLENILPSIRKQTEESTLQPVYACGLDDHLRISEREIAFVIEETIAFLNEFGLDVEGLFRLGGSATKIRKLKAAFDAGLVDMSEYEYDIHAVTGALKQYLRELLEPLMTFDLYDEWMEAHSVVDSGARLQALWTVVNKLPQSNFANMRYLIRFLGKVASNSEVNKMSCGNLALVIAPNIIWSKADAEKGDLNVHDTCAKSLIVESLIEHHDWFFPGDIDFGQPWSSSAYGESPRSRTSNGDDSSISCEPATIQVSDITEQTSTEKKLSRDEFPSVTGNLLSEVVDLINLQNAHEKSSSQVK